MTDRCRKCGRPIRWAWQIGSYEHVNPNVRNHRASPEPPPPVPSRPCGCPDYLAANR